jgi:hypothetical protein
MATLAIMQVDIHTARRMHDRARRGDPDAIRWFRQDLWADFTPPLECFLYGNDIEEVIATTAIPDRKPKRKHEVQQMLVSPICPACDAMPTQVRLGRTVKLLKALHGGRDFNFGPRRG